LSTYLEPYRTRDGTVMIPKRAVSEDGQAVGVGFDELQPDDEQYDEWLGYLAAIEADAGADWTSRLSDQME
jgi:hypothetical protein